MEPNSTAERAKTKRPSTPQPVEVATNPDALLKMSTVQAITGMGRSTIYDRMAAGTFPLPKVRGVRCTRWRAGDITEHLRSL